MSLARGLVLSALFLGYSTSLFASEILAVGGPAPKIKVAEWHKGKPVLEFAAGKTYVVEFWATWCGPCKTSIPHLTELAKRYKGKVDIIGVSVFEQESASGPSKLVSGFVKDMGSKMDYIVARDSKDGFMGKEWMNKSGQEGIPTAFIIHNKQIAWIGHPMGMDEKLATVVSGKFDLKAEVAAAKVEAEKNALMKRMMADLPKAEGLYELGKIAESRALLKKYRSDVLPGSMAYKVELGLLLRSDTKAATALIDELSTKKAIEVFRAIATLTQVQKGALLAEKRKVTSTDGEIKALQDHAIEVALKGSGEKDVAICYYAAIYFERMKEGAKALVQIDKALAALPTSEFKGDEDIKNSLLEVKKRLKP